MTQDEINKFLAEDDVPFGDPPESEQRARQLREIPVLSSPFPGYETSPVQPNLMEPEGNGSNRVCFVGEAPGEHEDIARLPFRPYAPAGSVFHRAMHELGYSRSESLITNCSWYRPPRNWLEGAPWAAQYLTDGRRRNLDLLDIFRPKVLVALGKTAFHELTGMYEVAVEQGRGYIVKSREEYGSLPVVVSVHPSYVIHGAKRKNVETGANTEKKQGGGWSFYSLLKRDISLGFARAIHDFTPTDFSAKEFNQFGSAEDWDRVIAECEQDPTLPISYDFETPMSVLQNDESEFEKAMGSITQFQISLRPGHALVSTWDYSLFPKIKRLMELPNPKWDWNGRGFDRDILRNLGVRFIGEYHDLMRMFSHWERDLPRGLQFVTSFVSPQDGPWKHTFSTDLRAYGVRDVHEPQKIGAWLIREMKKLKHAQGWDLFKGYDRHVYQLHTKVLDKIQERGIPIDEERRLAVRECLVALEEKVFKEINSLVPEESKPVKQPKGLKGIPKEIKEALEPAVNKQSLDLGLKAIESGELKKVTKKALGEFRKSIANNIYSALPDRYEVDGKIFVKRTFEEGSRWAELEEFNPRSSLQLLDYIETQRVKELGSPEDYRSENAFRNAERNTKWRVPMSFKEKKPTTAKKEIDRLFVRTKDPVLNLVIEGRELAKMRGTYIDGWAPGPDGLVHPFYDDNTGTSQLTAVNPAALTFPKHLKRIIEFKEPGALTPESYELGKLVRTMINPRPGYRLLEFDFKAFHVLTTGFEANDPKYMRLARLDMHSYIAATQLLKLANGHKLLELSDKELMKILKDFRKNPDKIYPGPGGIKVDFDFVRNKQAKPGILGYGFGMQAPRLFHENQEFIPNIGVAREIVGGLDLEFPITCAWRKNIVQLADRQGGFLLARYGGIRRFACCVDKFPVEADYRPRPGDTIRVGKDGTRWCFAPGDDAEAVIAYGPAHDAFGMIKETMLALEAEGYLDEFGFIIPIHDALVFHCEEGKVEKCIEKVKPAMEKPSSVLLLPDGTGLWCEAEASINKPGKSWASMEEIKC